MNLYVCNMYLYIYTYIYDYVYICICTCVLGGFFDFVFKCVNESARVCVSMCVCVCCVCMYVKMPFSLYVHYTELHRCISLEFAKYDASECQFQFTSTFNFWSFCNSTDYGL